MKSRFLKFAILFVGPFLFAQTPPPMSGSSRVVVVKFVAPPYPRAAKDKRMMGKAVSEISVGPDGSVQDVRILSAHPVFENPVRDALKQWRFSPTSQEYTLQVTVSFEFDDACEGTDKHPLTSESRVSAEFPNLVHIITSLQCTEVSTSETKH